LISDSSPALRVEIITEKGTDGSRFFRGEVDKYTWQEVGYSFLPGELTAAFLGAQLEDAESMTSKRMAIWDRYHTALALLEAKGLLCRPIVPSDCVHKAHMYYVFLAPGIDRQALLMTMKHKDIYAGFHYVPLHSSAAGQRYGRVHRSMELADKLSVRLVRLPLLWGWRKSSKTGL
jgi:dTDP-4-amino-4,6-dideoxygalactose transaminase